MLALSLIVVAMAFRGAIVGWLSREPEEDQAAQTVEFPLAVETVQDRYLRYQLIPVTVRVVDPQGRPIGDEPPNVIVTRNGERVKTIGHFGDRVKLDYDARQGAWVGNWPPGWNPQPGIYRIEARIEIDPTEWGWARAKSEDEEPEEVAPEGEAWAVAVAEFELVGRAKPALEPGLCVATWEFDYRETFSGPDGSQGDWRKLFDWVEYVGADTFWFRGGLTEPSSEPLTLERPFKQINLEAIPKFGREAHLRGIKFGTWAVAYATYGNRARKPDYDYSLDVSRSTGAVSETDYISLLDERRIQHLAEFFKMVQESEYVDMAGLDYMRTNPGSGGYELAERFAEEMPVELPENWGLMSTAQRQRYVAMKIEEQWRAHQDPEFYEAWNWWRAHLGAKIVRQIIDRSGIKKPTWIFVLSWLHGVQHGQDPVMFTDAGVTMLSPMLYQIWSHEAFDVMVSQWNEYLHDGQVNLVPGDQVDFYWHQETRNPPAPEELYYRIVSAHEKYIGGGRTQGAFWHDICRAASPSNLGPYSGREWALAGAAAFSTVRDNWRVYPLHAELEAPDSAPIASQFTVKVKLQNLTNQPVQGVRISLADTPHMVGVGLKDPPDGELWGEPYKDAGTVPAGGSTEVPVTVRITTSDASRLNETMLALRITWDAGEFAEPVRNELPRMIVLMKYIRGG